MLFAQGTPRCTGGCKRPDAVPWIRLWVSFMVLILDMMAIWNMLGKKSICDCYRSNQKPQTDQINTDYSLRAHLLLSNHRVPVVFGTLWYILSPLSNFELRSVYIVYLGLKAFCTCMHIQIYMLHFIFTYICNMFTHTCTYIF